MGTTASMAVGTVPVADAAVDIVAPAAAIFGTPHGTAAVSAGLATQMRAPLRRPPKGPGKLQSHRRCQRTNEHPCRVSSCAWMTADV